MITKHHRSSTTHKYRYGGSSRAIRTRYRYGGNGIFSNLIGRKLAGDSIKSLINSTSKGKVAQKVATAVLNGTVKPKIEQVTSAAIDSIIKGRRNSKKNKKKKGEYQDILDTFIQNLRAKEEVPTASYIEEVINSGKGIVYD